MQDINPTLLSQYANSPVIVGLLGSMNAYLDPAADIDAFYNLVWNVDTAQGWGLDVWGRIVGVKRVLDVQASDVFGFEEATPGSSTFGEGIFYSGGPTSGNLALSDTAYRKLILTKALANICDGSIPAINQVLMSLFPGRGDCYVTDGNDMTMTYTFTFVLTAVERAIVLLSGALPRPAGVSTTVVEP